MLPSYIPSREADKVLFVGESVQMFESDKHERSKGVDLYDSFYLFL